jgi:hypothetical protein
MTPVGMSINPEMFCDGCECTAQELYLQDLTSAPIVQIYDPTLQPRHFLRVPLQVSSSCIVKGTHSV